MPRRREDAARPELFGDFSQSDAADGEPAFCGAGIAHAFPLDESVHPDLSACSAQAVAPA